MATNTPNYNLVKPDGDDVPGVGVINSNMDKIDNQMKITSDRLTTQLAQTEEQLKLSDLYDKVYGSLSIYNKPSGFPIEIPFDIFLSASGKVVHNYDVSRHKKTVQTRCYVDIVNGDNNNPGTEEQPFQHLHRAYRYDPVDEIVLKTGVYDWSSGEVSNSANWGDASYNIIGDGDVYLGAHRNPDTWTEVEALSNVYSANTTNVVEVIDINNPDEPIFYTRKNSVEEVAGQEGSFHIIGSYVYVRTLNDTPPNERILLNLANNALNLRNAGKIYIENVMFTNTLTFDNGTVTGELYAKNCDFMFGTSHNAVSIFGDVYFELQQCRALYGERDGFNYHTRNGKLPKGLEIDCIGMFNGRDGANQNNGSTMHDGGTIVRISGEYSHNHGPNVIDVNNNTQSLNIGVHAHHSTATSSLSNVDFRTRDDADMWLVNCVSHDSEYSTSTGSPARMYKENTLLLSEEVVI